MPGTTASASCPCCTFLPEDLFLPNEGEKRPLISSENGADALISLSESENALSPITALHELIMLSQKKKRKIVLVDTHSHAHLERESQHVYQLHGGGEKGSNLGTEEKEGDPIVLLTLSCAVEESDWDACLEYSSRSPHCRAALGIHPWYLGDENGDFSRNDSDAWTQRLEAGLQQHPGLLVGEIGLCKMARWVRKYEAGKGAALELQRHVLQQQLRLAAKYKRPVSIHCVQQQGVFLEMLQALTTTSSSPDDRLKLLPPAMAMHSFSGTANQVQNLLQWEDALFCTKNNTRKKKMHQKAKAQEMDAVEEYSSPPARNPLLYFGFSHSINYAMCSSEKSRRQGVEAIRAVPLDRLLIESDVHATDNALLGTVGALAYVAWALNRPLMEVAEQTQKNAMRFFSSLPGQSSRLVCEKG